VIPAAHTVRIIPKAIPHVDQKILCAAFLKAVLRFYEDPANEAAFDQWRMGKGSIVYGQKRG